jgi:hypothetical protein
MGKPDNRITIGKTTMAILHGEDDLSGWTEEELERGQRRDRNGRWSGKRPTVVARALYDELTRRKLSAASDLLRDNTYAAVQVLTDIAKDPDAENRDRITAAKLIIERVMGKEPIRLDVQVKAKWEQALEASVVSLPQLTEAIDAYARTAEPEDDGEGRFR